MRFAIAFTLFIVSVLCEEHYPVPNINIAEVIQNDRLTKNYLDCILDKKQCTPDGAELKKDIPEALENECAKCTEKHREGIRTFIHFLVEKKPEWWQLLLAKYDPDSKYQKKYEHYLKKEGLVA